MSQDSSFDYTGWLVAQHLAKSYKKRPVVRDVSIAVKRGETVGLLGPNGAGKTTVFSMIMGLVTPDHGEISIDGLDITSFAMFQRGRMGIGYLPQESSIFQGLSVEKNILAILEGHIKGRKAQRARLDQLLDEFSLTHLRKASAMALSGGERRRAEIARALASDPIFMLLDEPFAGVDPIAVGDIRDLVNQLNTRGIGVLITDHNVRETLGLVDRAYILHSGKVMVHGTPEEVSQDPEARRVYLGDNFSFEK